MRNSICYSTRLVDGTKVTGGSFGGFIDIETCDRIANASFTVVIKPSGRAVFVDREGREVSLHLSVDPDMTTIGKTAITAYAKETREREERDRIMYERQQEEVDAVMCGLTHDEIIRRLTGG